jgi:cytosine/adenosine deaminase-related metal-dependent hydrolase
MLTLYCSSWVLPIASPVIEDGAVAVDGPLIAGVGARDELAARFPNAEVRDFGEAAILPGFVNTHTHLELTAMRGYLEGEDGDFSAWLKKLTIARLERMTPDDLYVSAAWGAIEAARAGVTCVGDASDAASSSMRALRDVGLRGTVYQESFGPNPKEARENFEKLREKVALLRGFETELAQVGVSPHAPYSVSAQQLELITEFALAENLPVMMHAAESEAETLFLREGLGPFAENLAKRGIEWHAPRISTIQYLKRHGILSTRPLLAHCVQVSGADLETIKQTGTSIAHCPKSNAKFGHGRAPFAAFVEKGITIGFGSDSVASNNTCDLLEESRFAILTARAGGDGAHGLEQTMSAALALKHATLGGAQALGLDKTGALVESWQADMTIISLSGAHQIPVHDPVSALVFASSGSDVLLTMVAGREVYREGSVKTIDEDGLRAQMKGILKAVKNDK